MTNECTDRDLLIVEPEIFDGWRGTARLAAGDDGTIAGASFTSAAADFASAGVAAGMVLCVHAGAASEARRYEIVQVVSATELAVSVPRAYPDDDPIAPPAGEDLQYFIDTFAPQIAAAQNTLNEKLRRLGEPGGIDVTQYTDSELLRRAVATGALAGIFVARAANASAFDANWVKAEHYRARHVAAVGAMRLTIDADGDGFAERTRDLGNITLRRA